MKRFRLASFDPPSSPWCDVTSLCPPGAQDMSHGEGNAVLVASQFSHNLSVLSLNNTNTAKNLKLAQVEQTAGGANVAHLGPLRKGVSVFARVDHLVWHSIQKNLIAQRSRQAASPTCALHVRGPGCLPQLGRWCHWQFTCRSAVQLVLLPFGSAVSVGF